MKTFTTLLICLLVIIGKLEAQDSTLILYYPLNEIYDIYVPDESGNDNRGLAYDTWPAKDRFGQRDMALYFNGNSFINFEAEHFNFDTYSYCMWVKIVDQPYYGCAGFIFDIGSEYGVDQYVAYTNNYSLYNLYGFLGQGYNTDGSSSWISQGNLVIDEEWHFIVYTRSYESIKLYFDGELIDELDINQATPLYGNDIKGYVGCRNNLQQFFNGFIDDVQLYNYAISHDDIIQLLGHLPTNIIEKYGDDIKIYPNPARQTLNIDLNQNIRAFTVNVYDIYGKKVLSLKNQTSFGVEYLKSGLYIIKLRNEDSQVELTTKFIKH
ncbi:MAG: T9SS type A sorting domain-containing protein [Bacteroidetes bacterium]|nr:T9SS type A sorting domain-containing protein [Bacteroidota bacterium]MBU1578284.1 T9SS type A sorting domain-containing protein [Bacteroidota bacterium]MBU2465645.1 T9SS type A sorting domain-containing protein [Bacteroidota bacterium]MBU2557196.1 T9SS type A sorting domain-containing protein [Bacteroidota bacterium]